MGDLLVLGVVVQKVKDVLEVLVLKGVKVKGVVLERDGPRKSMRSRKSWVCWS